MIHKETAGLKHLQSVRDGSFKLGLGIGCDLDNHLRFKDSNLVVMAGHANVGKTLSILYYFVCLAKKYEIKLAVFSSENEIGSIKDDIISLYTSTSLKDLSLADFEYAHYWLNEHFKFYDADQFFVENQRLMNFRDILEQTDAMPETHSFKPDALIIDPYNSLGRVEEIGGNKHEYDYAVMAELRIWCKTNKKACYILAHGNTEALRKQHPKGHDYEGYSVPLMSADIEGGGKFVNRCDDFVVIHRYTDHKTEWMKTEWHIKKVKNTKTGGKPTFKEDPIILEAERNLLGFRIYTRVENFAEPMEFTNPLKEETTNNEGYQQKKLVPSNEFDEEIKKHGVEYNPIKFTE
jgi:hypothetical protein